MGRIVSQWIAAKEGVLLLLFGSILSKILPPSNSPLLSAIQNDRYYCFLVPLTMPVIVVAVYFHWLSMKMFNLFLLHTIMGLVINETRVLFSIGYHEREIFTT